MSDSKACKCGFGGCKLPAVNACHKLWGKGGVLLTCQKHTPDAAKRGPKLAHLPFFYRVEPLS